MLICILNYDTSQASGGNSTTPYSSIIAGSQRVKILTLRVGFPWITTEAPVAIAGRASRTPVMPGLGYIANNNPLVLFVAHVRG
jgi:hypothetical protein